MGVENHIISPYFAARLDQLGSKIQAIATAMGLTHYIPVPWSLQVPVKNFRYTAPTGAIEGYLKASKDILSFPASCFGGFLILEENAVWITDVDPDDKSYPALDLPEKIPNSHPMLTRADIKILDNAYTMVNGVRTSCPNAHKIDKSYKEQTLPIWLRPTPTTSSEAAKTELSTDDEAANPPDEAIARVYNVEGFVLEQTKEDGTKVRDLTKFLASDPVKSKIKLDVVLNGYLLFSPNCRFKLFGPEQFEVPSAPCDVVSLIKMMTQQQY
jgi:hypothetical protein